jgi:hypothetical protein
MLISQDRIFTSIIATLEALQQRTDIPNDVLLDAQGMATMLRHTQHLEDSNGSSLRSYCRGVIDLLAAMQASSEVTQNQQVCNTLDELIAENLIPRQKCSGLKYCYAALCDR